MTFDRLKEAAASGRRSTLFRWLMRNHDRFAETMREAGRPNWEELAATFVEMGLKNREVDKPLSGPGVRLTWRKVKDARSKTPIKQAAASPAAPISAPVAVLDPAAEEPDDEIKFHDLKGRPF